MVGAILHIILLIAVHVDLIEIVEILLVKVIQVKKLVLMNRFRSHLFILT